jgi:hypothetical protein
MVVQPILMRRRTWHELLWLRWMMEIDPTLRVPWTEYVVRLRPRAREEDLALIILISLARLERP